MPIEEIAARAFWLGPLMILGVLSVGILIALVAYITGDH